MRVTPGPDGTVRLPDGVSLDQVSVSGRDLVIQLPNGEQIVIENGAVDVPQLVVGGVEIPSVNLAALLIGNEPQPAAGGPQSSGGNFARAVGDIGPGIGLGNLLPPTALEFSPPEFEEVYPAVDNDEPSVIIFPDDQPVGAPDVTQTTSDAGLPGGSDEGSGSNQTSGTITFHSGDTPATVTINGVHAVAGAIIPSEHGYLEIISVNNGDSPDGFVEYIFVQTENVLHPPGSNDVFEEIFEVVVTDADGDVATGTLTINILDDFPEAHADADSVAEHGPTVANGNVMTGTGGNDANNTDGVADFQGADDAVQVTGVAAGSVSSASGSVGTTVQGQYGTLTISASGAYTYTLNPNHSAVNGLDSGETLSDVFTYTITDADSDTSSTQLTITINGANDAPVANPDTNWVLDVTSGTNPTATGNVLQTLAHPGAPSGSFTDQADTDVDVETLTVTTAGTFVGTYGTLVLNSNGTYTYTLNADNAAVNALDSGETLTESFPYTSSDGTASANSTLTITIFGTNDAPVARADTNWAQEDVAQTASGNVLETINHPGAPSGTFGDVADTDIDVENLTVTTTGTFTGTYGTLTLNADGTYTYTVNSAAVQHLDDGETVTDTFNYTASDGTASASSTLTVTIFGNNDAPVANPDTNWVLDVVEGSANATGNVLQTLAHNGAPSGTFGDVADTDVDVESLTVTTTGVFVGTYGTLTLNADGSYTYALNTDHAAVNALDTGETLTDSFPYTASDGDLTANSTVTITIFGTNDGPVANPDTNWAQEDVAQQATGNVLDTINHPGAPSGTFGDVADTDIDVETLTVTTTGSFVGTYGTLQLNADGSYTYTLDNTNPAVQALDDGETLTDSFPYTATDGDLTASSSLTVTIFGNNDAPVANPDTNWVLDVVEGSANATGNVLQTLAHNGAPSGTFGDVADTDVDVENLTVTTTGVFVGTYGTLTLNADGSYSYALNTDHAAVNALDDGETLTDSFPYTASDGDLTANSTVTITIFGTNDGPVANPDTNWAQEDVAQQATGNVLDTINHPGAPSGTFGDVADTDIDVENLTVTTTGSFVGTYGTLQLNADGSYTYTVNNAAVQGLDDGETVTDSFPYTATDGSLTASSSLTVTIFGNNDAPVANPDTNWILDTNNGNPTTTGNVLDTIAHPGAPSGTFSDQADTDVDVETLTVTNPGVYAGTYGTLTLNADGSYSYELDSSNATVNALDNGETLTESFNYTASDGDLSANSTLTITIFGTNGAPVANADTNWAQEDVALQASGNVLQTLAHNGAPSGMFGDVADTDIDLDTLTVTTTGDFVGTYGTLHLNADGSYTYTLDNTNPAVQALDDGETLTDSFPYTATDGDASASSSLTVTIFGTNDAPVANPDTNWTQEDVAQVANGNVLDTINHPGAPSGMFGDVADTDIDVENLTVTTTGSFVGTYGTLQLNADGSYTYTLDNTNPAVQALDDGETLTDSFPYTATDGDLTASSSLTVTIFGNNDAPVANPDTNWVLDVTVGADPTTSGNVLDTINHPGAPSGTFGDVADTDVDVENLTVTTTGVFVGTYGTLQLNADGSYTYTLDADNAAVNALDDGETLTDSFPYTASDGDLTANSTVTITIFGTNDGPVANPDTNWAQEDVAQQATGNVLDTINHPGAPSGTFGDVADTDIDVENLTVTTTGSFVGTYGTLQLNADGSYTYTLDNTNPAVQALDDGETLTDSFPYTATDGDLTASSSLTVTIFGNNDAPIANPDTNWVLDVVEGSANASGNVLDTINHPGAPSGTFGDVADTDVDVENLTVTTTGVFVGTYGTLTLNADGSYTYALNTDHAAVNALDDGETLTDSFPYTASDGDLTANSTVTITIFGTNDGPVANPDTNWAQEDVAQQATGNVLDTINHPGAPSGTFGDVADTDVDIEALTVTTTGDFVGTYGTLHLNADGSYTYTLDNTNPAVQALDDGETVTDSFPYTATDGSLTASSSLTVTIFGNNDAPVANPDTNWVLDVTTGPNPTTTGNVLQTLAHNGAPSGTFGDVADTDVDVEALTVTTTGVFVGTYGTLTLNADGSYTYTLNASNAAVNALDDGETLTDSFPYTASDGTASANSTVTITIFGTNDAPVVTPATVTISEEGIPGANADTTGSPDTTNLATNGGTLAVTDVDGEAHTFTLGDPGAVLSVDGTTVTWAGVGTGVLIGSAGGVEVIRVTIDSDGVYSVQIKEGIDHATIDVEDTDSDLVIPVTVSDGTTSTDSTITVTIEDDSPLVTASGDAEMTGQTGSGTFAFNVGADHLSANDLTSYLTVSMTGSVGSVAISDVSVVADAVASTSTSAVYDISFDYAPNPADPGTTVTATGTLTFDGATYTVELDAPIQSYSVVQTSQTISSTGYNLEGAANQSEIVVSQLSNDFWVQFMGDQETGGGSPVLFSTDLDGDTTFENGELIEADQTYVTISGSSNGVAGDTLQGDEVLDMDFFTYDPMGTPQVGDAQVTDMFLQFDLYNTQDLVVILKLIDPDTNATTTKAIIVDAGDVYTNGDVLPAGYTGFTLDNNDGLLIIESNDYNVSGGENWVIYGAQVLSSTEGLSGSGINLNSATGASGGSSGTQNFGPSTVDTDVLKITNIGFVTTTTTSETLHLDIAATVTDGDGDSTATTHLLINPDAAPPVALDLDGDGVEFVSQSAGMLFDYNDDGVAEHTAWVSNDDGVLAIQNGDDVDVVFSVGGSTDLEGLAQTYDSNHDGVLSAADADFAKFGVLQNGEFTSLTDAGIESIGLVSDGVAYTTADGQVQVFGEGSFTWADGSTGTLADAAFAYSAAKTSEEAQRVFGQNAGGAYANLLAAAAMITAAATGFAAAEAPLLKAIGVQDFLGDVAPQHLETFTTQIETNRAEIVDAFDGGVKDGPLVQDAAHFSQDLSNLLEDAGFEAPQANEVLSTLLADTEMAPSLHDAAPMLVDQTVMPIIAAPLQAIAQDAPAAAELVAEVLADALSGGAPVGMSIDDMLSALPSTGGGATIGLSHEFSEGAMVLALHSMAFHHEATLVLHQDSVPVV